MQVCTFKVLDLPGSLALPGCGSFRPKWIFPSSDGSRYGFRSNHFRRGGVATDWPQLQQLRNQEYELKKEALENVVNQKLLEAETKKKGITVEALWEQEVDSKVGEPSDAEVQAYYLGQKEKLNRPFDEVKAQLRQALKQARIQPARR